MSRFVCNLLPPRCRRSLIGLGGAAVAAMTSAATAGTYSIEVLNFGDQTAIFAGSNTGAVLGFSGNFVGGNPGDVDGGFFLLNSFGFFVPVTDPTPKGFFPAVFTGLNSGDTRCGYYSDDPLLDFAISFIQDPVGNVTEFELGGPDTGTYMRDINDLGDTAGNIFNPIKLENVPFVRLAGGTVIQGNDNVLPAGHGMMDVTVFGLSNNGNLCGEGFDTDGNIVIWRVAGGVFEKHIVDHTMRSMEAVDIRNDGTVVGNVFRFSDGAEFPFLWDNAGITDLEQFRFLIPPNGNNPRAVDIADDGTIFGMYFYLDQFGNFSPRGYKATLGPATTCPADLASAKGKGTDGVVDVFDLFVLLKNWNTKGPGADLAKPLGVVDVFDLFELLAQWGPCEGGKKGP